MFAQAASPSEVATSISTQISFMGLIFLAGVGLVVLFFLAMILRTFTGRTHHGYQPAGEGNPVANPRSVLAPVLLFVGLLIAGAVMVGVFTLVPYQMKEGSGPVSAQYESNDVEFLESVPVPAVKNESPALPSGAEESEVEKGETILASDGSETASEAPKSLPSWTKRKQTILESGEVPTVLFVETSGLYSTQEEAMAEATKHAVENFRSRLAETYRKLAVQPVPEHIFKEASLQKFHVEKRMHSFGTYEEPMYRVYLEYLDSAAAREPVIEAWKSTFASNRAMQYGIGFGVLAALLGVVSAGLRAVSAAKGSRGRAVMTALAFAGLGLVGLLFVA